jgi:hypothetical protein
MQKEVLALLVVGNSESPIETLKKSASECLATQLQSLPCAGRDFHLDLYTIESLPPHALPSGQRVADQLQHRPAV